ncbi:hypothetical protein [Candidatus Palauibacter sp.]|uniref:hypothetical protein n=1 Tax=Candidatus Palauibacter sp. TaxID=3101350 RepID=UPI003B013241
MAKQVLPTFLRGVISYGDYNKWLEGKAKSHVVGDRERGFSDTSVSGYISDIHDAVLESGGRDFYTGEELDWSLLAVIYDPEGCAQIRHAANSRPYRSLDRQSGFRHLRPADEHVQELLDR